MIGHALRAWQTPVGVAINSAEQVWGSSGELTDTTVSDQLELLAAQVSTFALARAAGAPA